jgi:chromosome segregation ATPase
MTTLQINRNTWWEAKRHNAAQEAESYRHNLEQENISKEQLAVQREANAETARANRAREANTAAEIAVKQMQAEETKRSDLAREAENLRHNSTAEKLQRIEMRMENSREWAKLGITEERNQVQNQLDLANTQLRNVESLLKQAELDAGLPKAKAAQIWADISNTKSRLNFEKQQFENQKQWKERELTVAEKRQKSDELLNTAKTVKEVSEAIPNIAEAIGSIIEAVGKGIVGAAS